MRARFSIFRSGKGADFSARRGCAVALVAVAMAAAAPASHANMTLHPPDVVEHQALTNSVADLGLVMLKSGKAGAANQIVSPMSLASSLGLVHAGAAGRTAQELSALIAPLTAQDRAFQRELPGLLTLLRTDTPELTSANRLWLEASLAPSLPRSYSSAVKERYAADGVYVSFAQPQDARKTINNWVAEHTNQRIEELLPADALTTDTRMVLTNAMHFKAPWATPFAVSATVEKPFWIDGKTSRLVPTMVKQMKVRKGKSGGVDFVGIPFLENRFSMQFFVPPEESSLDDLLKTFSGREMAGLSYVASEVMCNLEIPRFKIAPASVPLKKMLQDLGVHTVFTTQADFTPLLGDKAKDIALDEVYHSAGITVEEAGVEAVAATAAVGAVKSLALPDKAENCQVNRPFLFTITHVATGTPVFMGKVMRP